MVLLQEVPVLSLAKQGIVQGCVNTILRYSLVRSDKVLVVALKLLCDTKISPGNGALKLMCDGANITCEWFK